MENIKKLFTRDKYIIIFLSLVVALSAQVYLNLVIANFRISFAIILIPICLFVINELDLIKVGLISAALVYFMRIVFHFIVNELVISSLSESVIYFFPELFFYIGYCWILHFLNKLYKKKSVNIIFINSLLADFSANSIEIIIRKMNNLSDIDYNIFLGILFVAIIRSSAIWIFIHIIKEYKMFLIKKEHEERYKELLYRTSRLKGEVYWMEKSMSRIEEVMTKSYELYTEISFEKNDKALSEKALNIAKDIHEIKKEYSLVQRGVNEIIENKQNDKGMFIHDIFVILKDTFKSTLEDKKISLKIYEGENFYTVEHYLLMSIFRNLIMNSVEAIEEYGEIHLIKSEVVKDNIGYHVFEVKDTGKGVEEKNLDHIFSPGFSTKINYVTGNINRGLGLSIIREIVYSKLNGYIEVESKADEGTLFKIFIPKDKLEDRENEDINNRR